MSRMRVGTGFDAHPFGGPGPLRLGGLDLPHPSGLKGHSDGDVLLHALADAILGAAGLPSLGEQFPDTDPAWRGADSAMLLGRVYGLAKERGLELIHADAVVVAEAPRLAPHREDLRARIAAVLGVPADRIGVRGTSSNGLGFPGRGEGIAAIAVVLLAEPGTG
jgi:2-C-methyl-D-erythritol 2,4-cyclodiphosphate synthase